MMVAGWVISGWVMSYSDLISRLDYCWRCMEPDNPHRNAIQGAVAALSEQYMTLQWAKNRDAELTALRDALERADKAVVEYEARLKDLERLSDESVRAAEERARDLAAALIAALAIVSRKGDFIGALRETLREIRALTSTALEKPHG